jgi:hypothetical protein
VNAMKALEVGDLVARTRGGDIVGRIVKIGRNPTKSSSIAHISVAWTNGHTGKVASHQIRLAENTDICGNCKMTLPEHSRSWCARGIDKD